MPKNKTKFNKNWLNTYPWISEVDDDIYKAYCKLCKRSVKVDVGGVGAVKLHQSTAKHKALSAKFARDEPLNRRSTGMQRQKKEQTKMSLTCCEWFSMIKTFCFNDILYPFLRKTDLLNN